MLPYDTLLIGFTDAVSRYETKAKDVDPVEVTIAPFEALNWSIVLEDHVRETWSPDGQPLDWDWRERFGHGAEIMGGVRFARNRVHHQRVGALRLDPAGFQFPMTFPLVFREWVWLDADQLPAGRPDPEGERVYRTHLEHRAARASLDVINGVFYTLGELLGSRADS